MDVPASTAPDWVITPGLVPYPDAMAAMQTHIAALRAGTVAERIWLLEHPPLYTAGTSARAGDLLAADRFPTFDAGRGGQWTYHGPGQRVAYLMLDLNRRHGTVAARDLHAYVDGLQRWLIATLALFGIRGECRAGRVGIWVADPASCREAKIAAIGVRVTRWVSWHGISLNVDPALDHFAGIVPCGIAEHGVTSLRAEGVTADMAAVDAALMATWPGIFDEAAGQVLF
jgi:lipoyl(octanoyl) transferase